MVMKMMGYAHLDYPFPCFEWAWFFDNEALIPGV